MAYWQCMQEKLFQHFEVIKVIYNYIIVYIKFFIPRGGGTTSARNAPLFWVKLYIS